jgi:hypothetical protein
VSGTAWIDSRILWSWVWIVDPIRVGEQEEETYIRIIVVSKGIFLDIVLLAKIASIKENTEPEKTVIVNKSLNYERLNMWGFLNQIVSSRLCLHMLRLLPVFGALCSYP